MGTLELVFRIAGTGAIGVACLALYFWRTAYGQLVQYASQPAAHDTGQLAVLANELNGYQRLVIGALVASVAVQLVAPLVDRIGPPPATNHAVKLNVRPLDGTVSKFMPQLWKDGDVLKPTQAGSFSVIVDKASNFDVDVLPMRDYINRLQDITNNMAVSHAAKDAPAAEGTVPSSEFARPSTLGF
jgi:hypothetical protein